MATNQYHFITHWQMKAQKDDVIAIFNDAESLPRWWPSVYLDARLLAAGDESGIGKRVALYTKGWLPYTLRWDFVVTEVSPGGSTLVAEGDFVGRGLWTFVQNGQWLKITYDWKIEATKPLLKYLSFALKPLFAMNHQWAMKHGGRSLELELRRRAGEAGVPAPPPATPTAIIPWIAHVLIARLKPDSRERPVGVPADVVVERSKVKERRHGTAGLCGDRIPRRLYRRRERGL